MLDSVFAWGATVLYAAQVVLYVHKGRNTFALIFFGYIVANVGVIWSAH